MTELLHAAGFWVIAPALALGRDGRLRTAWAVLAAAPLLALGAGKGPIGPAAAGTAAALAALAIYLSRRAQYRAAYRMGNLTRAAKADVRRIRARVDVLRRESEAAHEGLDRLQNRFALMQGMATRLDTAAILQALGALWSDVPGVRRSLLLQRRPNGNWAVVHAQGIAAPEAWVDLLGSYPVLTQGKRLRKVSSLDRVPFLAGRGLEPPFFLVPVSWGDDVMALGYVEVTPALFEEGDAGFNMERKLVSIGLRRAFLYDLMSERSRHDGLTGALLRRPFTDRLGEAARKSLRYKTPLFVAVMDLDHFKEVNDTYGHAAGDKALIHLAQLVREVSEPGVTFGRMGGDEFALLLETPDVETAVMWMERLRSRVESTPMRDGDKMIRLTLSAGLAPFFPEKLAAEAFMARADEALYQAKRAGRNRVVVADAQAPKGVALAVARVQFEGVWKKFGKTDVIKNLTLDIRDRELFVLVGPSGCGKSSILRLIAGLESPSAGEIRLDGRPVTNCLRPRDRNVAMVFQSYALYPHMTVYQNMAFGLRVRGYSPKEIELRVREASDALGLEGFLTRLPSQISGGQQQRVAVGRAIVQKPGVFLFDEPLSNLDAQLRARMRTELLDIQRLLKTTMIYVTHDQTEAMTMGDRLGVLREGTLQQVAAPLEMYRYPRNRFTAEFIGSPAMNFLDVTVREKPDGFWLDGGRIQIKLPPRARLGAPLTEGQAVVLGVRPEDLHDRVFQPGLAAEGNTAVGLVRHIEPVGAETYLTLDAGGTRFVARVEPDAPYQENQPVELTFNMERVHLFSMDTGERLPLEL